MSAAASLISFPVVTIFTREVLEGAIIIGEYRSIILSGVSNNDNNNDNVNDDHNHHCALQPGIRPEDALREVTLASLFASALALFVIAAVAIPLAILSVSFDSTTAKIIEGVSKIVAGICLLQLSLKLPKFLGIYKSLKKKNKKTSSNNNNKKLKSSSTRGLALTPPENEEITMSSSSIPPAVVRPPREGSYEEKKVNEVEEEEDNALVVVFGGQAGTGSFTATATATADNVNIEEDEQQQEGQDDEQEYLTIASIRFNVAWNIWREVAECGVFLIPFFLSGQGLQAIPLSAVIGSVVGLACGAGIYYANHRLQNRRKGLAIFSVLLLSFLSAGLFTGGCHNLEVVFGSTPQVWKLQDPFWDVNRLPMTVIKPFGYNDSRTVLEIVCFWGWLALTGLLHLRKYRLSQPQRTTTTAATSYNGNDVQRPGVFNHYDDSINKEMKYDSLHSKSLIDTVPMGDSSLEDDCNRYDDVSSLDCSLTTTPVSWGGDRDAEETNTQHNLTAGIDAIPVSGENAPSIISKHGNCVRTTKDDDASEFEAVDV